MQPNPPHTPEDDFWITYDPPPIPIRHFDWRAVKNNYDCGDPIGWGKTRQEAINDLLDQLDDQPCDQ